MLASMAERKQYRGNHAANLILFYQYSMRKSKLLHLIGRFLKSNYDFVISTLISVLNFLT